MTYTGIYLRHQLGDTLAHQGGAFTNSPDIISTNTAPMVDPSVPVTQTDYNNDAWGNTITMEQLNFIYIRGLNANPAAITSRIWFYYTQGDLALWPQNWLSDGVSVNGQPYNYTNVSAASPNQIVLTNPPFLWKALPFSGGHTVNDDHYCMIAFAENPPLSNPPNSPAPMSGLGTWDALAAFVLSNPGMAWRNTVDLPADASKTWQFTTPLTGADGQGQVWVGIQCNNIPTDGYFSVSVPGPDAANTINVPKTAVPYPTYQFTVPVTYPAGFSTTITVTYWQGATPAPAGSITPQINIPDSAVQQHIATNAVPLLGGPRATPEQISFRARDLLTFDSPRMAMLAPVRMHMIGSVPHNIPHG